jgi:hypothetical protein
MFSDILACLVLYYLFFILDNNPEDPISTPQTPTEEQSDSPDDWEPESEGGVTLPCSTPSPPPTLPSRTSTPETIVQSKISLDHLDQISEAYQALIDSDPRNWWHTQYGIFRHPFPVLPKPKKLRKSNI